MTDSAAAIAEGDSNQEAVKLLVMTVGGALDPLAYALVKTMPRHIWAIGSRQSLSKLGEIEEKAASLGWSKDGVQIEPCCIPDKKLPGGGKKEALDDLGHVTGFIHEHLWPRIRQKFEELRAHSPHLIVNYTGGTKPMSAALVIAASHWPLPLELQFVSGERKPLFSEPGGRSGIVQSGTEEHVIVPASPWVLLGYQAVERYVQAFDRNDFFAAKSVIKEEKRKVVKATGGDRTPIRDLDYLEKLAAAFASWDLFDYKAARSRLTAFADSNKGALRDLKKRLAPQGVERLDAFLKENLPALDQLAEQADTVQENRADRTLVPTLSAMVIDLVANARRRTSDGRFDDAVSRLYRAIEAAAQVWLLHKYGVRTDQIDPKWLRELLDSARQERQRVWLECKLAQRGNVAGGRTAPGQQGAAGSEDGETLKFGLVDSYALIACLAPKESAVAKLADRVSCRCRMGPLPARNQSLLAHGWKPVDEKGAQAMLDLAEQCVETLLGDLELEDGWGGASVKEKLERRKFPKLGEPPSRGLCLHR